MTRFSCGGRTEAGKLRIRNAKRYDDAIEAFGDCEVLITVEKAHATRSKPQNDYMWAVVIPRVQEAFRARGIADCSDLKVTNEVLKAQFMDPELVRTGRIRGFISDTGLLIGTHTSDLNKLQFIEYLERVVDHTAEYWKTYIPPPDPNWRETAEREPDDPQDTMRREKGTAA